jgi:DNA-binding GntR family transcriptional regulator
MTGSRPDAPRISLGAGAKIELEPSYTSRVGEMLLRAISTGHLQPDTLYSVRALAETLGVSRTPVREALIVLAKQGMVRFERNRGVWILEASTHELAELFVLRLSLEVPATYRATTLLTDAAVAEVRATLDEMHAAEKDGDEALLMRHDRLFHRIILEAAGNSLITALVDQARDTVLTRGASTVGRSRALRDIIVEHEAVLDRLEKRDNVGAAKAMHDHIHTTGTLILLQEGGDPSALDCSYAYEAWRSVFAHRPQDAEAHATTPRSGGTQQ